MGLVERVSENGNHEYAFEGRERADLWKLLQVYKRDLVMGFLPTIAANEEDCWAEGLRNTPEPFLRALLVGAVDLLDAQLVAETLLRIGDKSYCFIRNEGMIHSQEKTITLCSPGLDGKSLEPPPAKIVAYAQANPHRWKCNLGDIWSVSVTCKDEDQGEIGFNHR